MQSNTTANSSLFYLCIVFLHWREADIMDGLFGAVPYYGHLEILTCRIGSLLEIKYCSIECTSFVIKKNVHSWFY